MKYFNNIQTLEDLKNPRQGLVEMLIDEWIANNPEEFAPGGEFEGVALEDGAQYDPYLDDFVVVGRKGSLIAIFRLSEDNEIIVEGDYE